MYLAGSAGVQAACDAAYAVSSSLNSIMPVDLQSLTSDINDVSGAKNGDNNWRHSGLAVANFIMQSYWILVVLPHSLPVCRLYISARTSCNL